MTEYIEKAALMSHIEAEGRRWNDDYDAYQILCDIEDFPLADVRPVVLCKDCKYREYMDNRIPIERDWVCCMFDITTKETDFCSFGRGKGGDAE